MSTLNTSEFLHQGQTNSAPTDIQNTIRYTPVLRNAVLIQEQPKDDTLAIPAITPEMVSIRARYCILLERVEDTFKVIPSELHMMLQKKDNPNQEVCKLGESYQNTRSDIGKDLKKETSQADAEAGAGIAKRNLELYYFKEGPSYRTLLFGANVKDFENARNHLVLLGETDKKPAKLSPPKVKTVFQIIQSSWRPGGENLGLKTENFIEMRDREIERLKALPPAELEAALGEPVKRIQALKLSVQEFMHSQVVTKFREDLGKAIIVSKPLENAIMPFNPSLDNASKDMATQAASQKEAFSR